MQTRKSETKRLEPRKARGKTLSVRKTSHRSVEEDKARFSFRVRIGEHEVEIAGTREEVTRTIENLPSLVVNIQKAFDTMKPKTVTTLTVKTEAKPKSTSEEPAQVFPKIATPTNCEEAVLRILGTDWGKWRPRTVEELREAMKANELKFSDRVLSGTLNALSDKGMVRRWNTNTGFVYILAEAKNLVAGEEAQ